MNHRTPGRARLAIAYAMTFMTVCALVMTRSVEASEAPKPVTRVAPDYPAEADAMRLEGKVRARLKIDDTGTVLAVELTEEAPLDQGFGAAAMAALKQWSFQPGSPGFFQVGLVFRPDDGQALSIDGLANAPKPIRRGVLNYPYKATQREANGNALVVITIDEEGNVAQAVVAGEIPTGLDFGKAALAYARKLEFAPGQPGTYRVVVRFRMSGKPNGIDWYDLQKAPEPTTRIEPVVPAEAIQGDQSGSVDLAVAIGAGGRVTDIRIADESPKDMGFGAAAQAAVEQWRFEGAKEGVYRLTLRISPP